jgi:hypothetical protein
MTVDSLSAVEFIYCECGCGFTRPKYDIRGRERKFIYRHERRMENSPFWKGGRHKDHHGYWWVFKPEHPYCKSNGYVLEHRLVYEQYHKCCLLSWSEIHHLNQHRDDNRIENLELMNKSRHIKLHKTQDFSNRKCLICNTNVSRRSTGTNNWYRYKLGHICKKCYMKIKWNEKYTHTRKRLRVTRLINIQNDLYKRRFD